MPSSNLDDQVKLQLTNLQDQLVKSKHKDGNNISQNYQTNSQSNPKPLGPPVTCEQLLAGLFFDCKKHDSNQQCDSYSNMYKRFCSGPTGLNTPKTSVRNAPENGCRREMIPFPQKILAHVYCFNPSMVACKGTITQIARKLAEKNTAN
ncbi:hypothetical protein P3S67_026867 [Capsicum chacoense]